MVDVDCVEIWKRFNGFFWDEFHIFDVEFQSFDGSLLCIRQIGEFKCVIFLRIPQNRRANVAILFIVLVDNRTRYNNCFILGKVYGNQDQTE